MSVEKEDELRVGRIVVHCDLLQCGAPIVIGQPHCNVGAALQYTCPLQ
jgi:hypothetical protein